MAQQTINLGTIPDDGTGDSLRVGGDKINDNFTELYGLSPYTPGGTDVALADGGTGASLVDPNADRVIFWDDSAGSVTWLTMGTGLTITGTTLDAAAGSGYSDEQAQDAIGAMVDGSLTYVDATPLLQRAALTGDVTASAGSNATTIANNAVSFAKFVAAASVGVVWAAGAGNYAHNASGGGSTNFLRADGTWAAPPGTGSYTDEQAQDAIGAMVDASLTYVDATPLLQRAALTGDVTASAGSNATTVANANYSATLTATGTPVATSIGYLGSPINTQNGTYGIVMADAGCTIYHTSGSAHTWTIPANGTIAMPIGTILTFVNENGGGVVTLAITSDTLRWGSSTGSRSLAANGTCSALKVASTTWRLTGDGLS